MQTVVGLTQSKPEAENAVRLLQEGGFAPASVAAADNLLSAWRAVACKPVGALAGHLAVGAVLGVALFAYLGVLVTAGRAALGHESRLAAGAVLGLMAGGGVAGAALGLLAGAGSLAGSFRHCLRGIRQGGAWAVVRTADEHAPRAAAILRQAGAIQIHTCPAPSPASSRQARRTSSVDRLSIWTRWIARILGVGLLAAVALLLAGQSTLLRGAPSLHTMGPAGHALLLALAVALLGVLLAWRWEGVGGLLIVASILLFQSVDALAGGYWRASVLDPLFYLTGLLFLWDWGRTASHGSLSLPNL